jgi:uncharacterized membrane protein YuzA (DUF378 family)
MKATSSGDSGWDPYEVWSTRIRGIRIETSIVPPVPPEKIVVRHLRVDIEPRSHAREARRGWITVLVWVALALTAVLGLNRAIMGLFEVDFIAGMFGAITPAARAVYVLLGGAALYCAIGVAMFGRHRVVARTRERLDRRRTAGGQA